VSYIYNNPRYVNQRSSVSPVGVSRPIAIRQAAPPMGNFFDAAGVSVTTGNSTADVVIKYGFWVGLALVTHRMYRAFRYDEPLIQSSSRLPPAWEANPFKIRDGLQAKVRNPSRTSAETREILVSHGIAEPPEDYKIEAARYVTARDDWYILVESRGWYWYDRSDKGWKFLPMGLMSNPDVPGQHLVRVCSWCNRVWVDGEWVVAEPLSDNITHGICEECTEKLDLEIDLLD